MGSHRFREGEFVETVDGQVITEEGEFFRLLLESAEGYLIKVDEIIN
jgi:hypothetical protein